MSYDLYCYKSTTGSPDADEAEVVISPENEIEPSVDEWKQMNAVASALISFDPRLEIFQFDHKKIAENQSISIDEARRLTNYIEVNTPEDDANYVQFNITRDHVSLSFGFGMPPDIIERIMDYVDVICKETSYFLYDPQDGSVSDPINPIPLSDDEKKSWVENDDVSFLKEDKPWWKFW